MRPPTANVAGRYREVAELLEERVHLRPCGKFCIELNRGITSSRSVLCDAPTRRATRDTAAHLLLVMYTTYAYAAAASSIRSGSSRWCV
jgi:hypothetical protein